MVNDLVPRRRGKEHSKKKMEQCNQSVEDEVGQKEDEEEKGNNEEDDEDEANQEDNIIFEAEEEDNDGKVSIFMVTCGSFTWLFCVLVSEVQNSLYN